jgi:DnaJ domain
MRFRPDIDYYEVLQVHPRASQEMVKRAYRLLMGEMRGHPDLGGDEERAKLINEAYTVLSDAELRRAYDRARDAGASAGSGPGDSTVLALDRLSAWGRKVVLSAATVAVALTVARVLRTPALDAADLVVMLVVLIRIWNQASVPRGA